MCIYINPYIYITLLWKISDVLTCSFHHTSLLVSLLFLFGRTTYRGLKPQSFVHTLFTRPLRGSIYLQILILSYTSILFLLLLTVFRGTSVPGQWIISRIV